jgi:hypothetical protein
MHRFAVLPVLALLSACGASDDAPQYKSFDLELAHPSPYATFLRVTPGSRGADLPRLRQVESKAFAEYLRAATGCVPDSMRPTHVVGSKRMPAGYMVPITCP